MRLQYSVQLLQIQFLHLNLNCLSRKTEGFGPATSWQPWEANCSVSVQHWFDDLFNQSFNFLFNHLFIWTAPPEGATSDPAIPAKHRVVWLKIEKFCSNGFLWCTRIRIQKLFNLVIFSSLIWSSNRLKDRSSNRSNIIKRSCTKPIKIDKLWSSFRKR